MWPSKQDKETSDIKVRYEFSFTSPDDFQKFMIICLNHGIRYVANYSYGDSHTVSILSHSLACKAVLLLLDLDVTCHIKKEVQVTNNE